MPSERYVNIGAPFTRADGSRWEKGDAHIPTAHELRSRPHKLRLAPAVRGEPVAAAPVEASPPVAAAAVPPVGAPEAQETAPDAEPERWHMIMAPQLYLRLYPNGPHAEKARRLLKAEESGDA